MEDILINVSLKLWGETLNPSYITEQLGVEPSDTQMKGETKTTSTGYVVTAKIGMWCFSTKDDGLKNSNLTDHIGFLRTRFVSSGAKIRNLLGVEDACVDIFIAIDGEENGTECYFEMSSANLLELQHFGIPIRFTIAFCGK